MPRRHTTNRMLRRTIGFGDIAPQTWLGRLGTIFNALLPASLFFGASLVVLEAFFSSLTEGPINRLT